MQVFANARRATAHLFYAQTRKRTRLKKTRRPPPHLGTELLIWEFVCAAPLSYHRGVANDTIIISRRNFSGTEIFYVCALTLFGVLRAALAPDATVLIVVTAAVFLCAAVMTDIRSQIIPNKLNLAFFVCASAAVSVVDAASGDTTSIARACVAAALLFAAFWLLHAVSKQGLGGGDVKLAPSLGLVLGFFSWQAILSAILLAFLLNGLAAAIVVTANFLKSHSRSSPKSKSPSKIPSQPKTLPFAPTLACGTLLALLLESL